MSHLTPAPNVTVELAHGTPQPWSAVIMLSGEHDLATGQLLRDALDPLFGNILVDLTDCTFVDSTVIALLVDAMRRCERDGHRFALVVPPANATITRTFEIAGVRTIFTVLDTRTGAVVADGGEG